MPKKLHTDISTSIKQLPGALESLPEYIEDGQVVVGVYTHNYDEYGNDKFAIDHYYVDYGYYNGRIAIPHNDYFLKTQVNVEGAEYWSGGDTGGFYHDVESIPADAVAEWHYFHDLGA